MTAGTKYPAERDGQKIPPPEGVSLRPALEGKSLGRAQPIFWEHEANRAVRARNTHRSLVSVHLPVTTDEHSDPGAVDVMEIGQVDDQLPGAPSD